MNHAMKTQSDFANYLRATNVGGSGKAASYLRALELLEEMLKAVPSGFEDCREIWSVSSLERLIQLRSRVLLSSLTLLLSVTSRSLIRDTVSVRLFNTSSLVTRITSNPNFLSLSYLS